MKQVLQGRDAVNKVLEEAPHLKAGYHGLVTISLINLLIRKLAFRFKCPLYMLQIIFRLWTTLAVQKD